MLTEKKKFSVGIVCFQWGFGLFITGKIYVQIHPAQPFLFIKNKQLFVSSEGFSTLEKTALICFQRAIPPIHSGVTAL
jgi:hypothetical protein